MTQVCEAHNQVIVSFLQQVQRGARPTTEGSRENIGHNLHLSGVKDRNTRLQSVNAGARRTIVDSLRMVLGTTIQEPPHSPEDGHIPFILLIHIAFYHVSKNLPLLYLLNIYHFTYTFSYAHTEAHAHKHRCIISTQEE